MINILVGIAAIAWGIRTCYLGFRKDEAPALILTDDPQLGKSAHRLYGIGLLICGGIALFSEFYPRFA